MITAKSLGEGEEPCFSLFSAKKVLQLNSEQNISSQTFWMWREKVVFQLSSTSISENQVKRKTGASLNMESNIPVLKEVFPEITWSYGTTASGKLLCITT